MIIRNAAALCFLAMLTGMTGCANMKQKILTVSAGERVIYECEKGQRIAATYYSLSDGSLDFVKIMLPDGKERTLPRVLSASGVRYTGDFDLVWWTKGESAFAETRDENGEWRVLYRNCYAIPQTK